MVDLEGHVFANPRPFVNLPMMRSVLRLVEDEEDAITALISCPAWHRGLEVLFMFVVDVVSWFCLDLMTIYHY